MTNVLDQCAGERYQIYNGDSVEVCKESEMLLVVLPYFAEAVTPPDAYLVWINFCRRSMRPVMGKDIPIVDGSNEGS